MATGPDCRSARSAVPLVEIFRSIQGEGPHVGRPMVFVRTAVCPIRCRYCDTPYSFVPQPTFSVHAPGLSPREEENPCPADRAAEIVLELAQGRPIPVSFTGGEPLVWPEFLAVVADLVRPKGFKVHLETAALDPSALRSLIDRVDHLSADYKLPSTLEKGDVRRENLACVRVAVERGVETAVKVVLADGVPEEEWRAMLRDLSPFQHAICLVLQPATPSGAVRTIRREALLKIADEARRSGFLLRVLPQVHKVMDLP